MPARPDEIVELKGKSFVLLRGLLRMAHEQGFDGMESTIEQVASAENGWRAVAKVTTTFHHDGKVRAFTCIGDASPETTPLKAFERMAETRAMARCFRFALDIAQTALEELGIEEEGPPASRPRAAAAPRTEPRTEPQAGGIPACGYDGCGTVLTANQAKLSQAKYNALLCPIHQRVMDASRTGQ